MEWKIVKLGEIGEVVGGATPLTKNPVYYDGEISWITPKDLANYSDRYISRGERNITEEGYKSCSCKMLPKGSVLFSSRAPIGYIAIAENDLCTNQGFKSIIPNADKVDNVFLFYLLKQYKDYIAGLGSGTTFMEVSGSVMKNIELPLPPLETQRRIAAILSSLDDKIENNNRINCNLEAQAQALFKSWFVDFEPWGGVMPDDWKEGVLGEICKIKYGKGLSTNLLTDEGYPVFGGNGVIGYYSKFLYELPQILVSCRGAASGKIMESDPHSFVTSNSLVLEMNDRAYYYYLKYLLLANPLYNYATGSAQPQITIDNIKDVDIVLPSIDIVKTISEKFEVIDEQIRSLRLESARLAALRDTLLPKLMRGEIAL